LVFAAASLLDVQHLKWKFEDKPANLLIMSLGKAP